MNRGSKNAIFYIFQPWLSKSLGDLSFSDFFFFLVGYYSLVFLFLTLEQADATYSARCAWDAANDRNVDLRDVVASDNRSSQPLASYNADVHSANSPYPTIAKDKQPPEKDSHLSSYKFPNNLWSWLANSPPSGLS